MSIWEQLIIAAVIWADISAETIIDPSRRPTVEKPIIQAGVFVLALVVSQSYLSQLSVLRPLKETLRAMLSRAQWLMLKIEKHANESQESWMVTLPRKAVRIPSSDAG
jgi:hypothetical protein